MATGDSRPPVVDLLEAEIPHLRRWARHLTRDPDLADDLVQEGLLRAVRHASQWSAGSNMKAWLFAIVRNAYISDRRLAQRRRNVLALGNCREPSAVGSQESHIALTEVRSAFERLNDEHREVLFMVAMERLPYEDAAIALGVPVETIRSRLSRARVALKRELEGRQARARPYAQRA